MLRGVRLRGAALNAAGASARLRAALLLRAPELERAWGGLLTPRRRPRSSRVRGRQATPS
eukprot:1875562-Prymnesium_polylepis.1